MPLETDVRRLREQRMQYGSSPVPDAFQGVTKNRIREVLSRIDRATDDMVDVVYALLDDETDSMFPNVPIGTRFSDGATVAHIGSHVGILQRGGRMKLDREGRDYWLKPLWEIGAVEKVYLERKQRVFILGHPKAKSPNSAYRLAADFRAILMASEEEWPGMLEDWSSEDTTRERLRLQAQAAQLSRQRVDTKHSDLITDCKDIYVPTFLPGYKVLLTDVADGQRLTDEERRSLREAGIEMDLGDAWPDLLLWNPTTDWLWVVEAVTSDGEVDLHKFKQLTDLAVRSGKTRIGFTTAYLTWKDTAARQGRHKNIAPGTYVWILEDPSKHFYVLEMGKLAEL